MKIEVKERGSREFYEEMVYISAKRTEIEKKRSVKLNVFSKYYRSYIFLGIGGTLLMLAFYLMFASYYFLILAGMMAFATILIFINYLNLKKYIDSMMTDAGTKIVEVEKDHVSYSDGNKTLTYKWEDILGVVPGNHSVTFLPKKMNEYAIAVESRYKGDILNVLKRNHLEDLIIKTS